MSIFRPACRIRSASVPMARRPGRDAVSITPKTVPSHFKIQPGWVLTVEPAIYIKAEGFGVRLENTVAVTENGQLDLMANIPIEADEIEALMNRR